MEAKRIVVPIQCMMFFRCRKNQRLSHPQTLGLGYGVDILECGICKLFEKQGYGPFAAILCEVDHITSQLAGLTLVRTGTIATGAERCDFRFKVD